jgi:hypothetical protein
MSRLLLINADRPHRCNASARANYFLLALFFFAVTTASPAPADPVAVLTQHNDLGRTGANLNETSLNVTNVNTNQFGLVFTRAVDDEIHTQPLILTNVDIPGKGARNLVIVATVNDSLYAFDADDPSVTAPYWQTNFLAPNVVPPRNTDMTGACGGNYKDFAGSFGIVGTPVIDPSSGTLYVVVRTKEFGTNYVQRLRALDARTGIERPGSPAVIASGTTSGNTFAYKQNQRAGLALVNGYVYIAWSSHCDWGPYNGWIYGYNTASLAKPPVTFNATASGSQGGIWMSDQAPPADASGNVYVSTGNGSWNGSSSFGESFLKLTRDVGSLSLTDWFTPYNWLSLNGSDADLGSGGVLLIPGTSLLFSGGKAGWLYLVDGSNMGHVSSGTSDTNIVQNWSIGGHSVHGGPVWWDGPTGSFAYIWAAALDHLRQYKFDRVLGEFSSTTPFAQSSTVGGSGQPGGLLSLSADGTNAGSGILWASVNTSGNANQGTVAGTLHAYDAQNVGTELWNSDMIAGRDALGNFAKFVAPTVANGKVYVSTFSHRLVVFGLLPPPPLNLTLSGGNVILTWQTNTFLNYVLQSNTNLGSGTWSNTTNSVTVSNGMFRVTTPASRSPTFYRLKR